MTTRALTYKQTEFGFKNCNHPSSKPFASTNHQRFAFFMVGQNANTIHEGPVRDGICLFSLQAILTASCLVRGWKTRANSPVAK